MGKFLLVVVVFAAVTYGAFWLLERRGRKRNPGPARGPRPGLPRRSVAPDDDEDFLMELERRRRKAAREKQAREHGKPEKPDQDDGSSGRDQSSPE